MLSDEEIIGISMLPDMRFSNRFENGLEFARAIERAVLAKSMPAPKQEPVLRIINNKLDESGCFVDAKIECLFGGDLENLPHGSLLYMHPASPQAAPKQEPSNNPHEWRPIETAPTDDEHPILTWDGNSFDVCEVGWWNDDKPAWFNGNIVIAPSHWMPLPEPPK